MGSSLSSPSVGTPPPLWLTIVLAAVANGAAVAVAFGAQLSAGQTEAILSFVGSVSMLITVLVGVLHAHRTSQSVKLAAVQAPPAPPAA